MDRFVAAQAGRNLCTEQEEDQRHIDPDDHDKERLKGTESKTVAWIIGEKQMKAGRSANHRSDVTSAPVSRCRNRTRFEKVK